MEEIKLPIFIYLREVIQNIEYISEKNNEFVIEKDFYFKPTDTYYRKGETFMIINKLNK